MSFQIELIRKENCVCSLWSSGTTTQLYIYPKDAIYQNRNFAWRLSSARVEIAESDFTPLPGFQRIIMIIEGELLLMHAGHHEVCLKPFEQDTFLGEWQTKSRGIVTDFNLMMNIDCQGSLTALYLSAGEQKDIDLTSGFSFDKELLHLTDVFYLAGGSAEIIISGQEIQSLKDGDLLLIKRNTDEKTGSVKLQNSSADEVKIIQVKIRQKLLEVHK